MKIVICSKNDLAGNLALNRLVNILAPHHEIHVVLSDLVLKAERQNPYAGFLLKHERDLPLDCFFPWLDSLFPIGSTAPCQTVAGLAATHGITVELWSRPRTPQAIANMQRLAPELILSCRYDYILPREILSIPRLGAYGLHPGQLPQIRGLCGPFQAMRMGHKCSGCTLFHIDHGIDTGPIVDIGWTQIGYSRSLLWNFVQTYFAGIDTFRRYLPILAEGQRLPGTTQDSFAQRYYGYPTESEFNSFLADSGTLVCQEDYLELLSLYLPNGQQDANMPKLERLIKTDHDLFSRGEENTAPECKSLYQPQPGSRSH